MLTIKKFKASTTEIGSTEYKLWRYPLYDGRIGHIKNEYDFNNCLTHFFDVKATTLDYGWAVIQFPWIEITNPKQPLRVRYYLRARPTNLRHDDLFMIRPGALLRFKDMPIAGGLASTWRTDRSMFFDEMKTYIFDIEIELAFECLQPLIGLSAKYGSKTSRKKGVGLYWEYMTVLADIEWEHLYIIVQSRGLNYTVFYKVSRNGEKIKEKTINEVYNLAGGVINRMGGFMAAVSILEGNKHYRYARFNDDFEIIKKVHEEEEPYPCGQWIFLYELADNTYLIPSNPIYDDNIYKIVDSDFLVVKSRKIKGEIKQCQWFPGIYRKDPDNFLYMIWPFGIYKKSPFPEMEIIKSLHLGGEYNNYSADLGPDRIYFFGNPGGGTPAFYFFQISFDLEVINQFIYENTTYAGLDVKALWVDTDEIINVFAVAPYPWAGREKGIYILKITKEGIIISDMKLNFIPDSLDLTDVKVYTLPLWGG